MTLPEGYGNPADRVHTYDGPKKGKKNVIMAIAIGLSITVIILVLAVIIYTPHKQLSQESQKGSSTYTNLQNAFSVIYPASWQYDEHLPDMRPEEMVSFYARDPPRDVLVSISKVENTDSKDFKNDKNTVINHLRSDNIQFEEKSITVDGKNAYSLEFPAPGSDNQKVKFVTFMNGADRYRIWLTVTITKYDSAVKQFDELVSSFHFLACDPSLWAHVYHPDRLDVVNDCITVTAGIEDIRAEEDGDYHVLVKLDPQFANLINEANREQNGNLVVEPICQKDITQDDAESTCLNFSKHIDIPSIGSHVQVVGSYVLDTEHGGWAEIHPATYITEIAEASNPVGSGLLQQPNINNQNH